MPKKQPESIFEEKLPKRKLTDLKMEEAQEIVKLHKKGISVQALASQYNLEKKEAWKLFKDETEGERQAGGKPKKGEEVSNDEIHSASIKAVNELIKTLDLDPNAQYSSQSILRTLKKSNIYKKTREILKKQKKEISLDQLSKRIRETPSLSLEAAILPKAQYTPQAMPAINLEDQDEWYNCINDPKWEAKKGQVNTVKRGIRQANDLIAARHGVWEDLPKGLDPLKITKLDGMRKLTSFLHKEAEKLNLKTSKRSKITPETIPHLKQMNYIPISQWTQEDIYFALYWADAGKLIGTLPMRIALRRLKNFTPGANIAWETIEASRSKYQVSKTITEKEGLTETQSAHAQASPTLEMKIIPKKPEMDLMLSKLFEKENFKGDLTNIAMRQNAKPLTLKQKIVIERRMMKCAVDTMMDMGCRIGSGSKATTGLRSLVFKSILAGKSQIKIKDKKMPIEEPIKVSKSLIDELKEFQEELETIGVNTDKIKIVSMTAENINRKLANAAEAAGLVKYTRVWGIHSFYPMTNKPYVQELPKDDPNGKWIKDRTLFGHSLTATEEDIDFHAHLFRAYHLDQLYEKKVPFEVAIGMGVPWKSMDVPKAHYIARRLKEEGETKYRQAADEILTDLNPVKLEKLAKLAEK